MHKVVCMYNMDVHLYAIRSNRTLSVVIGTSTKNMITTDWNSIAHWLGGNTILLADSSGPRYGFTSHMESCSSRLILYNV